MNAGKLVFSKSRTSGAWFAEASGEDDDANYRIIRHAAGGWLAQISHRLDDQTNRPPHGFYLVSKVDLGWAPTMARARELCNADNRAVIMKGSDEGLKAYMERWPA